MYTIAAADTLMFAANADLMAPSFPGISIDAGTDPNDSMLSIAEARRVLGYVPHFTWRT